MKKFIRPKYYQQDDSIVGFNTDRESIVVLYGKAKFDHLSNISYSEPRKIIWFKTSYFKLT